MHRKIELGKYLLGKGEGARALEAFNEAAHESPAALREIANCYDAGLGVKADSRRAKKYQALAVRKERVQRACQARRARNVRRAMKEGGHWLSWEFSDASMLEVRNHRTHDHVDSMRALKEIRPPKVSASARKMSAGKKAAAKKTWKAPVAASRAAARALAVLQLACTTGADPLSQLLAAI